MEAQLGVTVPAASAEVQPGLSPSRRNGPHGLPLPVGVLGDERLARLVGEGNERAFATLFARYHQPLYRYCHSMLRHEPDAQDALQSTFTAALVALRRGQRDAPLRPWLFRIAHNESVSLLRRRRPADELSETMPSPRPATEDAVAERADLVQLVVDLQALPERQRGALVMRELSGLSHEDLAQALGISVGAAKQTVFEARRALQEFSEGRAMACEEIQRLVSDGDRRALRGRRVRAHLRGCSACTAFQTAIPARSNALMALCPVLPAAAASGLLSRILHAGSTHHGGGGGLLAGATGKSLGLAVSAKTLATGAAIVATAAAGVGAVDVITHSGHSPAQTRLLSSPAAGKTGLQSSGAAGSARAHSAYGSSARHHHGPGGSASGTAHSSRRSTHSGTRGSSASRTHGASTTSGGGTSHSNGSSQASGNRGQGATGQNPNAHGGNPNAGGGNSGTGAGNPNAHGGNSGAGVGSTNAHGGNPNAGGGNPNAGGGNPNPGVGSTNAHGGNPNAGGGSINAHGGNPNAAGTNPNIHGRSALGQGSGTQG